MILTYFSISAYLSNLEVRTVDAAGIPYFYATDVANVFGIDQIRKKLGKFTDAEIVSDAVRQEKQLKTYKINRGKQQEDPNIKLLTERGVCRLAFISDNTVAKELLDRMFSAANRPLKRTESDLAIGCFVYVYKRPIPSDTNAYELISPNEADPLWNHVDEFVTGKELFKLTTSIAAGPNLEIWQHLVNLKSDNEHFFQNMYGKRLHINESASPTVCYIVDYEIDFLDCRKDWNLR
jgi:hypothetical protein